MLEHKPYGPYEKYIKRPLDCVLSVFSLIALSPLLLVMFLLIKIDLGGSVIFKQYRTGRGDKKFGMYKFRSMTNERDENGILLPDEQRVTKLGAFMRKTSIDELPSLINIIKGEMAIIGPRPLPVRYLERYNSVQRRRHEVRPGLSNPSTANGRNNQSWEKQLEGDVWYVDNVSFINDVKSVIDTIKVIITQEGATADDGGARREFIGIMNIEDLKTDAEGSYIKLENDTDNNVVK